MSRPTDDLAQNLRSDPRFLNGEVHQWYRLVLGYPDHLVAALLDRIPINQETSVLDPFCGSGTTLVECMKRGVPAVGIDANPVGVFASLAKTDWSLDPARFLTHGTAVRKAAQRACSDGQKNQKDPTYRYLELSGMLKRGWISAEPLRKALALKRALAMVPATTRYQRLLRLCLLSEVVYGASNMKFGPEIFCGPAKADHDVFGGFQQRIEQAASDLKLVHKNEVPAVRVVQGDSRRCDQLVKTNERFSACICSPPYPTEHDYTRNTRLELAFMEAVHDVESLRRLKKLMIRSHTKNIYKGDRDRLLVNQHDSVTRLVKRLRKEVEGATGFVGLYPEVVAQYFGGMKRHFASLRRVLRPGAKCAYVVGDQSSYRGIHIPTAKILGIVLDSLGFVDIEIQHWRGRWSSTRSREVDENILFFSKKTS